MAILMEKGDSVAVADIEKLRPELLSKSDAELERLATEIAMAQAEKRRRAEAEQRQAIIAEAGNHVDAVIASLKWLHDNGLLPAKATDAFTRSDGQFNPATFLRAPKADDVVVRRAKLREGPRRYRRRRLPDGTLAPSKAAQAAGVDL